MTAPDDISRAYEAFFDALIRGPWVSQPGRAHAELEARRRALRALAVRVDRSLWPPGVATLLWTPAPHEIPASAFPFSRPPSPPPSRPPRPPRPMPRPRSPRS